MQQLDENTKKRLENGTLTPEEMKALGLDYDDEIDQDVEGEEYGEDDDVED